MTFDSFGLYLTIKDIMIIVSILMTISEIIAVVICLDMLDGYKLTSNNVFSYIVMVITLCVYLLSMSYLQSL